MVPLTSRTSDRLGGRILPALQGTIVPLRAIAYASEARPGLSIDHVDDLARVAAGFNFDMGVTGVLLYDGCRFLQYIEGPEDGMDVVHSRILGATSHHEVVVFGRGRVSTRQLPYWPMRLVSADPGEVRTVANGDWYTLAKGGGMAALAQVIVPHLSTSPSAAQSREPSWYR